MLLASRDRAGRFEERRKAADPRYQQWRQTLAHLAQQQPAAAPPPASPKQQDRAKRKLKFGGALLGTGVTLAVLGLLQIVTAHPAGHSFWALWRAFAVGTTFLAGGSALAILGGLRKKQSQRLQQYAGMIDPDCGYLSIYELADRVHRPYKQVCEDLQKMIDMRTWDAAWLDLQRGRLMLTPYDPDEEAPAADTMQERQNPPPSRCCSRSGRITTSSPIRRSPGRLTVLRP